MISADSRAQNSIGVDWNTPEELSEFENDLEFFKAHNVSFIILNSIPDAQKALALKTEGIPYLLRLNNRFITNRRFKADSASLVNGINKIRMDYDSSYAFAGVIGFSDSDIQLFSSNTGTDFYFEKNDSLKYPGSSGLFAGSAVFFKPVGDGDASIHDFKNKLIDHTRLIVTSSWLKSVTNSYPDFGQALRSDINLNPELIPLPDFEQRAPIVHWSIVVLLLLWISLAVNIATNPTYLEIIPRYFTAHRFFVDDIMSYRERSSKSAVFLLFQHAVFGGLTAYIIAKIFISDTGLEALYYHLPYIAILGKNYFSLFVLVSVIVFLVELIALVWLYVPNKEMTHFNQALNLFTWMFHLDFILVTAIVTAFFAGLNSYLISSLAVLYVLIWFSSFNITALAASSRLGMTRNSYLIKTIGLHTLVSGFIVALLFIYDGWLDLLELVVSV